MFRTLRNRLILSHILPLIIVVPLIGAVLVYVLETQVLLPQLANNLVGDARLLAEISRTEYELWGNPVYFERMLSRVQMDPAVRVMFLSADGHLLFSSDPTDAPRLGHTIEIAGLNQTLSGQEMVLAKYSGIRLQNLLIDVLSPVVNPDQHVIGVVRVTYHVASVYEIFSQLRYLISIVLVGSLIIGAVLGSWLALNIEKPIQRVTQVIYALARGDQREPIQEEGPEEIRGQIRAVNYLVERLHSLEQSRRQLLANLVHELGRPLGALRSGIHALIKGAGREPELLQELTTGMEEEAIRLQGILDDLAHLYDQVLGTLELKRETTRIGEWLLGVLRPWQEAASEKGVKWAVEIPEDLPVMLVDPARLEQVVGNLVSNAIKYTPAGRSAKVMAGVEGGQLWIRVSDTGPGMPSEDQEKIFEPFFRGDQGKRIKQGMGLGLSIARDLVIAHEGRIEIESTPGLGSHFTVWLPIVHPTE